MRGVCIPGAEDLASPFMNCSMLGKLLNIFKPRFPHLPTPLSLSPVTKLKNRAFGKYLVLPGGIYFTNTLLREILQTLKIVCEVSRHTQPNRNQEKANAWMWDFNLTGPSPLNISVHHLPWPAAETLSGNVSGSQILSAAVGGGKVAKCFHSVH